MAEHRLTDRLAVLLPPTRRLEKLISLGLLFVLLLAAIVSLTDTFWGPDWASLWHSVFFGLLLGWMLGIFRQPAYRVALIVVVSGFFYVLLFPSGLSAQAGAVLLSSGRVLSSLVAALKGGTVQVRPLVVAWQELFLAARTVLGQVWAWFVALSINPSAFDPLAVGLVWDALIWLASAWAGWVIVAWRDALLAAFPAFMLSVGALAVSQRVSLVLYITLGTTLLLLAAVQLDRRKQVWDELGVAYPLRKGRQIANAALVVTLGLVLLSAVLSSISFQRIRDWISEQKTTSGQANQSAQATLVEGATLNANQSVQGVGQPRDHLINGGPETSDRVVMTVSVGNLAILSQGGQLPPLYWRSATYDIYTGHGWSTSATQPSSYLANQPIQADHATGSILVEQDVFPVENLGGSVYAAGEPVTLSLPGEAAWRSPGDLFGLRITGSSNYKVYSLVPVADVNALRAAGQDYPAWVRQNFLALPPGIPARVKALAVQLTASQPTAFDQALAIENYLRTYPYTLEVPNPPKQQDVVDYFLFDLEKGYCDYYASAMVVLAREIGIPARLAVGYGSGTYNLNSKRFVVTEADAHSWVEVYFPGLGWVPFEPTAASPQMERPGQAVSGGVRSSNPAGGIINGQPVNFLSFSWLLLLGIIILAAIAGIVLVISGEARLRQLPEASAAALIYQRLKRYGSRLAVASEAGASPYEFAASLQMGLQKLEAREKRTSSGGYLSEQVQKLVDGIVWACYHPSPPQNMNILRQWNELRWRLDLMWMLKAWKTIRDRIKGILAGIPRKARIEE